MVEEGGKKYASDFITSRIVPESLNSFEKVSLFPPSATPQSRPVNRLLFGARGIETDSDVAEDNKESTAKATETKANKYLSAGSSPLDSELTRLAKLGHTFDPSTSDSKSTRLADFKTQVSSTRYNAATTAYSTSFNTTASRLIRTTGYKNATPAKQAKMITAAKEKALGTTLSKYGYKKPKT